MPVILNPPSKDDLPNPEKGDIVKHIHSNVEYVLYDIRERKDSGGKKFEYPVFLIQLPNGKLSRPKVVFGDFDVLMFVERGSPREPGEKPVRPLNQPSTPGSGDLRPNFNKNKKKLF